MVSLIGQKIGELLASLEQLSELDNTVIIYASDHGEMLADHGLRAKMNCDTSSVRMSPDYSSTRWLQGDRI